MNEKYERQMKKGVLDMLVLKLLEGEMKYGYQLIQEMKEKSGGVFLLKEGTLYPVLYRLEDEGLVESWWSEAGRGQIPRKYYLMTEKGRRTMGEMYERWSQIAAGVEKLMGQKQIRRISEEEPDGTAVSPWSERGKADECGELCE